MGLNILILILILIFIFSYFLKLEFYKLITVQKRSFIKITT